MPTSSFSQRLTLLGMSCASCALRIERALRSVPDVIDASVNLTTEQAAISSTPGAVSLHALVAAVRKAGYNVALEKITLQVQDMSCASCVTRVEKALLKASGVLSANVNLVSEQAILEVLSPPDRQALMNALSQAGYKAQATPTSPSIHTTEAWELILGIALTLPLLAPMLLQMLGVHVMLSGGWQLTLATPVQWFLGARFYRAAWGALRARASNMDLLVAIGTSAAYFLSLALWLKHTAHGTTEPHLYFEASAAVITLVRLGKWLERRAKHQTLEALDSLKALCPSTARIRREGIEQEVPITELSVNDCVMVRPGERIAVDGEIIEGRSHVDESLITGESLPVLKDIGSKVTGGAINTEGVLLVKTLAVGSQTLLSRMIELVQNAQATKAPIQHMVDRVSAVFVPVVVGLATLTFLSWGLLAGTWTIALIYAVTVLVIACPCALGLATSTAIMAGTGLAAKHGILIRDAQVLERAHAITTVVFDKTGTLTQGHPTLTQLHATTPYTHEYILCWAASLQQHSQHPLAKAVLQAAQGMVLLPTTQAQALSGRGIQATVQSQTLYLGSTRWQQELQAAVEPHLQDLAQQLQSQGQTISWLMSQDLTNSTHVQTIGLLAFGDELKPQAAQAIQRLHHMGIRTLMLTGDNLGSAQHVAQRLGITEFQAEVLPADKAAVIQQLKDTEPNAIIAMVGDGINDAPALATADVGMALSTGTDIAMQTAGITLMHGNPTLVAEAIHISRQTYATLRRGLFWAFAYNALSLPLAALGQLNPVIAGAAMALSSISVVVNALWLKRYTPRT